MAKQREMNWEAMFADRVRLSESGCLEFTGYCNPDGYGSITCRGIKRGAHRLSYLMTKGPIPDGYVVLHECDNPGCVNPDHLRAGEVADNVLDMEEKGRARKVIGSAHGQSKLNELDVCLIRSSKESGAALARQLGVTKSLVCQIRRGIGWSHVGESNVA